MIVKIKPRPTNRAESFSRLNSKSPEDPGSEFASPAFTAKIKSVKLKQPLKSLNFDKNIVFGINHLIED